MANGSCLDALEDIKGTLSEPSSPLKARALYVAGTASAKIHRDDDAIKYFTAFIDSFPINSAVPEVMLALGKIFSDEVHDCQKAITVYNDFSKKIPARKQHRRR